MHDFDGKVAVVTGGASGMGRAFAERFAQAGMNVVLADIEEEALETAVRELEQQEHRVIGVVTNTMSRDSVQALAQRTIDEFGKIHIVCNNAGVISRGDAGTRAERGVWEIPQSDWDWVMGVNFWGVLYGLQVFIPHMLQHGEEGHIVNTASLAGLTPGGGAYGVSKHGVLALSEGLYRDLKSRDAKISASVLCPGFVNTRIFAAERNRPEEFESTDAAIDSGASASVETMLQQAKLPSEVAEMVFAAIQDDQFYILPHPAWDETVRSRVEQVLARGAPLSIDFEDLLGRLAAGEDL
jgi:NAD(P)-dependent dehydrogenase (short-subunit alcohol dehydrogenase family)